MKGVLLFAFNNGITDYYEMAIRTAKRVNQFLNLPVSVVTGPNTDLSKYNYKFDNIFIEEVDDSNKKGKEIWINKGRHKAFELTPYDETIILDTDYLINSDKLLKPFELYDDFMCHNSTSFIMIPNAQQERVSNKFINTCWATVMYFKKTDRTKRIFECMQMIQDNYQHYVNIFEMNSLMYRNDYSLTIALWIVNGHTQNQNDYIPWPLLHLNQQVQAHRIDDTSYIFFDNNRKYVTLKDVDFHLLSKKNFMDITNE